MKFHMTVQVDFRNRYARDIGQDACEDLVLEMITATLDRARENVQPGFGPGPHPHPTVHVDTGALAAALDADVDRPNDYEVVGTVKVVGSPMAEYGAALELGWHTANGGFYQYPWLAPAFEASAGDRRVVRRHGLVKAKQWVGGRRARRGPRR